MKTTPLTNFDQDMIERCKAPEFAALYLSELASDPDDGALLIGLGYVARAHGIADLSDEIGISRKGLYLAFSDKGNPTLKTFIGLLEATGIRISFTVAPKSDRKPPKKHAASQKSVAMAPKRLASGRTRKAP